MRAKRTQRRNNGIAVTERNQRPIEKPRTRGAFSNISAEFATVICNDLVKWRKVIKDTYTAAA
jgi:hypothetical protein